MTTITLLKQITPELSLQQYNEIPVIALQHRVGSALIALQGAHLFSWKPQGAAQDVFWLSEVEPFSAGNAIRGGVPICYPWFGSVQSPPHGYARISLWQLSDYAIAEDKVRLKFSLFSAENLIEAKISMQFCDHCELTFTHYGQQPAQAALHSYFHIGDIESVSVAGLPTTCFNSLQQQNEPVPSPRRISANVDGIYAVASPLTTTVHDPVYQRNIVIEHNNATEVVLWNPWHKATSGMSEQGYKTMVCVESARINHPLSQGEQIRTRIKLA
ncbi:MULTISPECIES: D-hexose-6-phosphate mutarotase [Pasteurellaceae]|uniref:D-hexose-6-phosphate mutarotase n=1 Tax=Pasteurellaceae TaxID=712 RepID=UPI00356143F8